MIQVYLSPILKLRLMLLTLQETTLLVDKVHSILLQGLSRLVSFFKTDKLTTPGDSWHTAVELFKLSFNGNYIKQSKLP
jgi:hypothetical protein